MRKVYFLVLFISNFSYADEFCLFEPCAKPPTKAEFEAVDKMLLKVKYVLGAAYTTQNNKLNPETGYKNIPDFRTRTKKLKQDIATLHSEAKQLNTQAGGFVMDVAIAELALCVSFNDRAIQYCHQALSKLKTYQWEKDFGTNWSDYPYWGEWNGFPENLL